MPTDESKKKKKEYDIAYQREHLKRIPLNVRREFFDDVLKPAADSVHEPVNTFIRTAIDERIEKIKPPGRDPDRSKHS